MSESNEPKRVGDDGATPARSTAPAQAGGSELAHARRLVEDIRARVSELDAREAELAERRASVDKLYRQAGDVRDRAARENEQISRLREQLAAREAELRRAALQVEVDREQLGQERANLSDHLGSPGARAEVASASAASASPVHVRRPGLPAARATVISIVLAVAGGAAWLVYEAPRTRSSVELTTFGERSLAQHVAALRSAEVFAGQMPSRQTMAAWNAALASGRVGFEFDPGASALEVWVESPRRAEGADLLKSVLAAYAAELHGATLDPHRSPRWREWNERQGVLQSERALLAAAQVALERRRGELSAAADWDEARAELDRLRGCVAAVQDELSAARGALAALRSQQAPRGSVSTEQSAEMLAGDPVYQEDTREFESQAKAYRAELALAMLLVSQPFDELRRSAQSCAAVVREQLDLQPKANIRAVLEQCQTELDDFDRLLAEVALGWRDRRALIERGDPVERIVELVGAQTEGVDVSGRALSEAQRVLAALREKAAALLERPDAATREHVVASVLRGEISRLGEPVAALGRAARQVDTAVNFKLDAADRQIRGLRTRLGERRQRVARELQQQADRLAAGDHEERLRRSAAHLAELDESREELIRALVSQIETLRSIEEGTGGLRALNGQASALEGSLSRMDERLDAHRTLEPEVAPDRIEAGVIRNAVSGVPHRWRHAGLVAGIQFLIVWIVMISLHRRRGACAAVGEGQDSG